MELCCKHSSRSTHYWGKATNIDLPTGTQLLPCTYLQRTSGTFMTLMAKRVFPKEVACLTSLSTMTSTTSILGTTHSETQGKSSGSFSEAATHLQSFSVDHQVSPWTCGLRFTNQFTLMNYSWILTCLLLSSSLDISIFSPTAFGSAFGSSFASPFDDHHDFFADPFGHRSSNSANNRRFVC